jgi:hypothetical protein
MFVNYMMVLVQYVEATSSIFADRGAAKEGVRGVELADAVFIAAQTFAAHRAPR